MRYITDEDGAPLEIEVARSDTFDLFTTLAPLISASLEKYIEDANEVVVIDTDRLWEILWCFKNCTRGDTTMEEDERIQKGFEDFGKVYRGLWW